MTNEMMHRKWERHKAFSIIKALSKNKKWLLGFICALEVIYHNDDENDISCGHSIIRVPYCVVAQSLSIAHFVLFQRR